FEGKETPEEAAHRIGPVEQVVGDALYVTPTDVRYVRAIVHFDKQHKLHSISIRAADGQHISSMPELEARLGHYDKGGRTQPFQPIGLSFTIDFDPKGSKICTLVAFVANDDQPVAAWRIQSVTLMADPKL